MKGSAPLASVALSLSSRFGSVAIRLDFTIDRQCLMALELHIPSCVNRPPHRLHPPPPDQPLRIRIQGPLETIQKLLPNVSWHPIGSFPQLGGVKLASLTFQKLYGGDGGRVAPVVRDEYLAWVLEGRVPQDRIDYYGVTFDYLVSPDDPNPEVLAINIIEVDNDGGVYADGGKYANKVLLRSINPIEYTGKKVLAVPRCCQHKKGSQDRQRINSEVMERMGRSRNISNGDAVYKGGLTCTVPILLP
ncbi:uncharacterized protein PV09_09871 [Verruconis gallopava]|uniref:Uncharacterized protein n=1 Tax=Verruconis gallopava TaxID=253628 RepID=A0A0D1YC55_9PEZI|nr:uncharacterized protein PV09_09871 [Verruconis gallopava]KIV98281.1 hypothetical protein PV09_09871 [Verruconis gallopava]